MTDTNYFHEYAEKLAEVSKTVDEQSLQSAFDALYNAYAFEEHPVYVIGNGGSAAIAQHFSCDHTKGIWHDTPLKPKTISLATNIPLMTAIANDYSFEEIYSKQIEYMGYNAVLVAISSGGNSPNIIRALNQAKQQGWVTIAFVGFDGGKIKKENLADHIIHVNCNNYGIIEDIHQMIMHSMSQHIRYALAKDRSTVKL